MASGGRPPAASCRPVKGSVPVSGSRDAGTDKGQASRVTPPSLPQIGESEHLSTPRHTPAWDEKQKRGRSAAGDSRRASAEPLGGNAFTDPPVWDLFATLSPGGPRHGFERDPPVSDVFASRSPERTRTHGRAGARDRSGPRVTFHRLVSDALAAQRRPRPARRRVVALRQHRFASHALVPPVVGGTGWQLARSLARGRRGARRSGIRATDATPPRPLTPRRRSMRLASWSHVLHHRSQRSLARSSPR